MFDYNHECQFCGNAALVEIGCLGNLHHLKCRACGMMDYYQGEGETAEYDVNDGEDWSQDELSTSVDFSENAPDFGEF